jgi:acyl dehydratase
LVETLYWEDIDTGTDIRSLEKNASTQQLVRWAGASGDFYQIHYDKDFAQEAGLPGVIVHGALKSAWLGQMLSDWIGETGRIKRYGCSYHEMDVPNDALICKGTVTKKYVEGNEHLVECEIWVENSKGEKTTSGSGLVALPTRG